MEENENSTDRCIDDLSFCLQCLYHVGERRPMYSRVSEIRSPLVLSKIEHNRGLTVILSTIKELNLVLLFYEKVTLILV